MGKLRIGCIFAGNVFNHLSAAEEWWHFFQDGALSVKSADSHWTAKLVGAKGKKVCVQILNVHLNMWKALGTVNNNNGSLCSVANLVGIGGNFFYRVCNSKYVANMGNCNELCLCRNLGLPFAFVNYAVVCTFKEDKLCFLCAADHLPGKQV